MRQRKVSEALRRVLSICRVKRRLMLHGGPNPDPSIVGFYLTLIAEHISLSCSRAPPMPDTGTVRMILNNIYVQTLSLTSRTCAEAQP